MAESHFYLFLTMFGQGEMKEALNSSSQLDNHRRSTTLPNIRDSDWEMDDFDFNDDADFSQEGASEGNAEWEELGRPL